MYDRINGDRAGRKFVTSNSLGAASCSVRMEIDMLFERKIYKKMKDWKAFSKGGSALLIEGARRIGKSTVAEHFAKNEYEDYLLLDFSLEPVEVRKNFENIGNPNVFFRNLFLLKGKELPPGKSVVIFDEVQLFPPARQAIKQLVKDGRYDYIETGSLISIRKNVQNILIPSEEYKVKMYPMDFEEFLWATGDRVTMPSVRDAFQERAPLGAAVHRKIMRDFRTYMAVGGMPQAVEAFVSGTSYKGIDFIKRNILSLYEEDLKKYDADNNEKASVIFRTIPSQLARHKAHFVFSEVDKNARYKNYVEAVEFVAESMMGNICVNVSYPDVSLEMYEERNNFKLYMGDTGLLVTQIMRSNEDTEDDLYKSLIFNRLDINQGMIMENIVAQMLRTTGHELYFHEYMYQPEGAEREKKYEIDFLTVRNRKIVPIEIKSSGYSSHRSFDYFTEKYPIPVQERIIIYGKDVMVRDGILYIPFYMAGCL